MGRLIKDQRYIDRRLYDLNTSELGKRDAKTKAKQLREHYRGLSFRIMPYKGKWAIWVEHHVKRGYV